MSNIKHPLKSFATYLLLGLLITFSSNSYSMLCPSNYNTIELGYSIEKIIDLCGAPDERSEYKETVSLSSGQTNSQSSGIYSQYSNNYYSQGQGNSQQLNDVKEKVIIHTKLIYRSLQPSALIFENGILTNRELLYK